VRTIKEYVELTAADARSQWGRVLRREPRPRQEAFTPVEVILCYALFFVVDPHRFGGGSMGRAPKVVHELAALFVRPSSSITSKMMNLDGSRAHGAAVEWQVFVELATNQQAFPVLYNIVMFAARDMGVGPERLPDFLALENVQDFDLLGQEELSDRTFDSVVTARMAKLRLRGLTDESRTSRLAEQLVRVGQHRFATEVLDNFGYACAFCGFEPRSLRRNKLLIASHIKPWADSDDRERVDPRNGIAACPTHDAAFDTGLITVNGGLRVHKCRPLEASARADPGVAVYFEDVLRATIQIPDGATAPDSAYLAWHHEHIFQGEI